MSTPIKWTALGTKQAVSFYDPLNPGTVFNPQLNPLTQAFTPGNVRKYVKTTNGTSIITGDREYPPTEIKLIWSLIDKSDYDNLRYYTSLSPIVFVDNNNNGFLGVLVIDNAGQIAGKTSNVWSCQASFLVLAPYNGISTTITNVTPPTLSVAIQSTPAGFIPSGTTFYVYPTIFTPWGESLVGSTLTVSSGGTNNASALITYSISATISYEKIRLYWNSTNNAATATFLTDIFPGGSNQFTIWGPYFQYSPAVPPTYGTAFYGYWDGGIWTQVTPV